MKLIILVISFITLMKVCSIREDAREMRRHMNDLKFNMTLKVCDE